jgi:DNA-binding NarL/FixJ family response regulator
MSQAIANMPRAIRDALVQGEDLSEREITTLKLYALGQNEREIAKQIGVCCDTVRNYRRMVLSKLNAKTIAQAVGIAVSLDLI